MAAVTCEEIRELFTARADEALGPGERARLDAHLATCAECAREWERFAGTVGMLRAMAPARAPAGFVDRVLAARRRPWYRRLAQSLLTPWPVKLPLEAAAIVLLGGLAIMVFQRSPDLPASIPPPAAARREAPPDAAAPPVDSRHLSRDSAGKARRPALERGARGEADEGRGELADRQTTPAAPAPAMQPSGELRARSARAGVQARLAVDDAAAAERRVRDLVIRAGGEVVARSDEAGAIVLNLVVAGDRWDEVRRGLQALGALRLEDERERPDDRVRVTLRLEP